MIRILKDDSRLILEYRANDYNDATWVDSSLEQGGKVTIGRVFRFNPNDVLTITNAIESNDFSPIDDDSRQFLLGNLESGYYRINKEILGPNYDLLIFKDVKLSHKSFIAHRYISIFQELIA